MADLAQRRAILGSGKMLQNVEDTRS